MGGGVVLMAYPLEQGLKRSRNVCAGECVNVLMAYPLEQGLKPWGVAYSVRRECRVLMAYPLEQGLKLNWMWCMYSCTHGLNGLSTRTRIETRW